MDLTGLLEKLSAEDAAVRERAATEIFRLGCERAESATKLWRENSELAALLGAAEQATVGLAVFRAGFAKIRAAHGTPLLAEVPPDQDAEEFELHFADGTSLDVLTSRAPGGNGAIARFLARFGEGVQQVEYPCKDVDRATQILQDKFDVSPVYKETRAGADGARINFFLAATPGGEKVLIELVEKSRVKKT
jgi:hypothetical protein